MLSPSEEGGFQLGKGQSFLRAAQEEVREGPQRGVNFSKLLFPFGGERDPSEG